MASCVQLEDGESPSALLTLEGYIGGAWVELGTSAVSLPAMPTNLGDTDTITATLPFSFSTSATCELRATLTFLAVAWTPSNTGNKLTASARISDFRFTATDTQAACTGSGGTGGDGDTPGGGGGPSACVCEWTPTTENCATWDAEALPTDTWSAEGAPGGTWAVVDEC